MKATEWLRFCLDDSFFINVGVYARKLAFGGNVFKWQPMMHKSGEMPTIIPDSDSAMAYNTRYKMHSSQLFESEEAAFEYGKQRLTAFYKRT